MASSCSKIKRLLVFAGSLVYLHGVGRIEPPAQARPPARLSHSGGNDRLDKDLQPKS
jgi:hypothetical protein